MIVLHAMNHIILKNIQRGFKL